LSFAERPVLSANELSFSCVRNAAWSGKSATPDEPDLLEHHLTALNEYYFFPQVLFCSPFFTSIVLQYSFTGCKTRSDQQPSSF